MTSTAHALAPNRAERLVRSAVVLYIALLVAVPLLALLSFGLSGGTHALVEALRSPVARSALWLTVWTSSVVAVLTDVST